MPDQRVGNHRHLLLVQIRGDFHEDRFALAQAVLQGLALCGQGAEQLVQGFVALQRAQVLGVWTGNIDRDVVRVGVNAAQGGQVVLRGVFDRGGRVFTDIQAQQHLAGMGSLPQPGLLDVVDKAVQTLVVEAESIDQGLFLGQAEHARLGVAGLPQRCHGAHFHKAKAERSPGVDATGILVQSGGQPHAVGKNQPSQGDGVTDSGLRSQAHQWGVLNLRQPVQGQVMGRLRIHLEQKVAGERVG